MKIRNGYVSNSSSSSFCIFGWSFPNHSQAKELMDKINKKYPEFDIAFSVYYGDYIVGVGEVVEVCEDEIDYDFVYASEPSSEEVNKLEKIAKELEITPSPENFSGTWFNG